MNITNAEPTIDEHNNELLSLFTQLKGLRGDQKSAGQLALMRQMTMLATKIKGLRGKPSVPEFEYKITLALLP